MSPIVKEYDLSNNLKYPNSRVFINRLCKIKIHFTSIHLSFLSIHTDIYIAKTSLKLPRKVFQDEDGFVGEVIGELDIEMIARFLMNMKQNIKRI